MATACEYSRDTIDSIVLKSATMSVDEDKSWTTSSSEPPSASERLVDGLEEAMSIISDMLQSSGDVMEKFKSEWDSALTSYQIDVGVMDEDIERMGKEQKRRKKRMVADEEDETSWSQGHARPQGPEADHALNFHLKAREEHVNDGSDIFMLPADKEEMDITVLSDEQSDTGRTVENELDSTAREVIDSKTASPYSFGVSKKETKKNEERARFDSVTSLITKMQTFREEEARIMKQLSDAQPKDNGMTALTLREREDLEDKLDQCRARQTKQVVASVTDYKPRFRPSSKNAKPGSSSTGKKKSSGLGLYLPAIEDILEDALSEAVPIGRKEPKSKPVHKPKSKPSRQEDRYDTSLTLSYRDVSATEQHVLRDPDNFLTVHELSIENPSSKRLTGLSALVKSNTRPLNAMEMGRRKRIDK